MIHATRAVQGAYDRRRHLSRAQQLRPGIALSAAQVAQLTSDVVWLVSRTVQLPDGSTTTALVPQVFLAPKAGDLAASGQLLGAAPTGALISARDVELTVSGDVINSGTIAGQRLVDISAQNITNTGLMQGQVALLASAGKDFNLGAAQVSNRGSGATQIKAGGSVNLLSAQVGNTDRPGR